MRRQLVDVPAVIARHVERLRRRGHERRALRARRADGELPEMWVDPDKLDQVLANLMENAVRHGEGTVTIESSTPTRTIGDRRGHRRDRRATRARASRPSHYPLVFTRFWRGRRRGGTGLGLYIVRAWSRPTAGTITRRPGPGGGAEFRFTLPAGTPATSPERRPRA